MDDQLPPSAGVLIGACHISRIRHLCAPAGEPIEDDGSLLAQLSEPGISQLKAVPRRRLLEPRDGLLERLDHARHDEQSVGPADVPVMVEIGRGLPLLAGTQVVDKIRAHTLLLPKTLRYGLRQQQSIGSVGTCQTLVGVAADSLIAARTAFAAATRLVRDAIVSSYPRVLRPQSGLAHSRLGSTD